MGPTVLNAREVLHNISGHDYDSCGNYPLERREAEKVINILKVFISVMTKAGEMEISSEQEPCNDVTPTQRWIPVSERMPNFNDIVLASADSDYNELRVIITVYGGEEFWFNGKIKAWRPLPEPYRAESEG